MCKDNRNQRFYQIFENLIISLYDITIDDIDQLKPSHNNIKKTQSNLKTNSYIHYIKECIDSSNYTVGVSYQEILNYVSHKKGNRFKRKSLTTILRRFVKNGDLVLIKLDKNKFYQYRL